MCLRFSVIVVHVACVCGRTFAGFILILPTALQQLKTKLHFFSLLFYKPVPSALTHELNKDFICFCSACLSVLCMNPRSFFFSTKQISKAYKTRWTKLFSERKILSWTWWAQNSEQYLIKSAVFLSEVMIQKQTCSFYWAIGCLIWLVLNCKLCT